MHEEKIGSPSSAELATGFAAPERSPTPPPPAPASPAPPVAPVDWRCSETVLGGYRVESELGVGGMGRVYLLVHPLTRARFAVKRCQNLDEEGQRRFLFELLTWADLPPHPNLLPLRFFRTDGNEVYLFSDYAEGGSLHDWIEQKRLTTLKQILDVAIQFAWGLHVGHEHGVVHQDVKPRNVLMTAAGVVMVGDYGLARSCAKVVSAGAMASLCVSHGGFGTWAYQSPEQSAQLEMTRRSDLWSWGLSVLEIFTGGPTWAMGGGLMASEALEDHLRRRSESAGGVAMPDWLGLVLRKCFQKEPRDRWETMASVIEALCEGWREEFGGESPRELCPVPPQPSKVVEHDRRTTTGVSWRDPVVWMREALQMNGRDPGEAEGLMPRRGRWRRTQAMADMVALWLASRMFERVVAAGNTQARERLARLCGYDRAFVHESLGDLIGALPLYESAIVFWTRLVEQEGRSELANDLAKACMNKAVALRSLGEGRAALPLYDRAIELLTRLVDQEGRSELANDLAAACMNKAIAVGELGDERAALSLYDRAIELLTRLVDQEGRSELANDLANACMNKGNALGSLGEGRAALSLYDRAIELRTRLVDQEGRSELVGDLAWVRLSLMNAQRQLGDPIDHALVRNNIAILRAEVERTARADLRRVLQWAESAFRDLLDS